MILQGEMGVVLFPFWFNFLRNFRRRSVTFILMYTGNVNSKNCLKNFNKGDILLKISTTNLAPQPWGEWLMVVNILQTSKLVYKLIELATVP